MKVWGRGALSAVAAIALLALPAVATPALAAKSKGLAVSSFTLKGSHGYELEAISFREGSAATTAGVTAKRGDLRASYEIAGHGGLGIHADLGSLGHVEVHFQRRKRVTEDVSKGCRIVVEIGIFRGDFEFEGEGGYTQGAARSVPGQVLRLPDGFCIFDDLRAPAARPSPFDLTTLSARSRTANGSIEFEASRLKVGRDLAVSATLREKVGALKISRSADAHLPKRVLRIGPGKSPLTASLKLSSPFSGEAEFQGPANGPATWTGSLNASLPGAPAVALAGPGFAARLCVDKSLFESCKADLLPAELPPEPQL
jgi:hypothetical protein